LVAIRSRASCAPDREVARSVCQDPQVSEPDVAAVARGLVDSIRDAGVCELVGFAVVDHPRLGPTPMIEPNVDHVPTPFTALWRFARMSLAGSGWWPLVVGEAWDNGWESGGSAAVVASGAAALDGRSYLTDRGLDVVLAWIDVERTGGAEMPTPDEFVLADPSGPAKVRLDVDEMADHIHALGKDHARFVSHHRLALVPGRSGADAAASIGWCDGNGPTREQHVASLAHLEDVYGAELALIDGATVNLALTHPVDDPAQAVAAAVERLGYADATSAGDTPHEHRYPAVAVANTVDLIWSFWWD
jgi:hypothetical protein